MGMFSSIFGTNSAAPAPGENHTVITSNPPATAPAPAPTPAPAPLDPFSKLWEPTAAPTQPDNTSAGSIFASVDQAKMLEAARGVNFTSGIDPALITRVQAGGADGGAALLALLNDVGQRAYAQASFASTQIVDRGLSQYDTGINKRLPDQIKRHSVAELNGSNNPAFKHPAVAPVVALFEQQFQQKYPQASAAEISSHVQGYLTQLGTLVTGGKDPSATETKNKMSGSASDDWTGFFPS